MNAEVRRIKTDLMLAKISKLINDETENDKEIIVFDIFTSLMILSEAYLRYMMRVVPEGIPEEIVEFQKQINAILGYLGSAFSGSWEVERRTDAN